MIHDTSPSASTCAMASSSRQMALWISSAPFGARQICMLRGRGLRSRLPVTCQSPGANASRSPCGATCSSQDFIDLPVAVGSDLYASVGRCSPRSCRAEPWASAPYDVRQVTESSACCSGLALVGGAP